jgi:hypothetical protein
MLQDVSEIFSHVAYNPVYEDPLDLAEHVTVQHFAYWASVIEAGVPREELYPREIGE